jgi:hypothetical protein
VLIEFVLVACSLGCVFGCVLCVRLYCSLQLQRLDDARQDAWSQAMKGCDAPEPELSEMAHTFLQPSIPFPDGLVPELRSAERTFAVSPISPSASFDWLSAFALSGRREMKFICNPIPGKKKPLTDMVGWLMELFT